MSEKKILRIEVRNKIARLVDCDEFLVCGNNDYEVHFDFDEAWNEHHAKTALFVFGDETIKQPFKDNVCDGVVIEKATRCYIGVFSGDLITTTKAEVKCRPSIRDIAKTPKPPKEDVYNKLISLINSIKVDSTKVIINVEVLPEKDINYNAFYRTEEGIFWYDTEWHKIPTWFDLEAEITRAKKAEKNLKDTKQDNLSFDGEYDAIENPVATLQTVIRELAKIIDDAPEKLDTLKEVANKLEENDIQVAQMILDIKKANDTSNEAKEIAQSAKNTADTLDNTIQSALLINEETRRLLRAEEKRAEDEEDRIEGRLDTHINETYAPKITALDGEITELKDSKQDNLSFDGVYNKDTNKVATVETVSRKVAEIIAGADEDFDTLKELSDWLTTHGGEAAAMNSAIKVNSDNIAKNRQDISNNATAITNEVTRAKAAEDILAEATREANENAQKAFDNSTATLDTASRAKALSEQTEANLNSEIAIARGEESRIEGKLDSHIDNYNTKMEQVDNSISDNATAIANEIKRATDADIALDDRIDTVESIAKGANQSVSFGNYSTMITALNVLPRDTYNIGQNIMIVTVEVPDLWVSAISDESVKYEYFDDNTFEIALKTNGSVQVGYFVLSQLETQKVDLTDYAKRSEVEAEKLRAEKAEQNLQDSLDEKIEQIQDGTIIVGSACTDENGKNIADTFYELEEFKQKVLLNRDIALTNGTKGLAYRIYEDYAECTGRGECTDTEIEIASVVMGLPVISISSFGPDPITSITIPESVTSIGRDAFYNSPVKNVTIKGDGYIYISQGAFEAVNIDTLVLGSIEVEMEGRAFFQAKITEVKYVGTEEDWADYVYLEDNEATFSNANITYNYVIPPISPYGNVYYYD